MRFKLAILTLTMLAVTASLLQAQDLGVGAGKTIPQDRAESRIH